MNDEKAYAAAIRLLAASDKTRAELFERLTAKGFSEQASLEAVKKLTDEGYLNEKLQAENTVMRLFAAHYGCEYIRRYISDKKFCPDASEHAETIMSELDFDASAKEYYGQLIRGGKTPEKAAAALWRRGFGEM